MNDMTKEKLLELVLRTLPYPDHIRDIDLSSDTDVIRFTWRGDRFRVTLSLSVGQIEGGCEVGNNISLLMAAGLRKAYSAMCFEHPKA